MDANLNHIVIFANLKCVENEIQMFSSNVSKVKSQVQISSLDISDMERYDLYVKEWLDEIDYEQYGTFVISDNAEICSALKEAGIAYSGLLTEYNQECDFSNTLYLIEELGDISYDSVEGIWMRFKDIPWTIAQTERLIIREQTVDDVEEIYRLYNDFKIKEYVDDLAATLEEEKEYIKDYIRFQYRLCEYGIWAIVEKSSGKIIGRAGLEQRDDIEGLEIGYVIGRDYRQKGYAKEAVRAILEYAREEYGLDTIHAFTRRDNVESVALLEKFGFAKSGEYCINQKVHDRYDADLHKVVNL